MPGPSYHGRTHLPDGTDPIPFLGLTPWAHLFTTGNITVASQITSTVYVPLDLDVGTGDAAFNTSNPDVFEVGDDGGFHGISVLKHGVYLSVFQATAFQTNATPEVDVVRVQGDAPDADTLPLRFGQYAARGFLPQSEWDPGLMELRNYRPDTTYPATPETILVNQTTGSDMDFGAAILIVRLGSGLSEPDGF